MEEASSPAVVAVRTVNTITVFILPGGGCLLLVRPALGTGTACVPSNRPTTHRTGNPMSRPLNLSTKNKKHSVDMKTPTPTAWTAMACILSWTHEAVAFLPPAAVTGSIQQVSMLHTERYTRSSGKAVFRSILKSRRIFSGVMWFVACGMRDTGSVMCC